MDTGTDGACGGQWAGTCKSTRAYSVTVATARWLLFFWAWAQTGHWEANNPNWPETRAADEVVATAAGVHLELGGT